MGLVLGWRHWRGRLSLPEQSDRRSEIQDPGRFVHQVSQKALGWSGFGLVSLEVCIIHLLFLPNSRRLMQHGAGVEGCGARKGYDWSGGGAPGEGTSIVLVTGHSVLARRHLQEYVAAILAEGWYDACAASAN